MKTTRKTLTVVMMMAAVGLLAGGAHAATTTMTATANGPNGSHDDWNLAGNWSAGVPSGAMDAVVSTNLFAEAWNTATPSYDGPLVLGNNATLQMGWTTNYPASANAMGGAGITMNSGSALRLRLPFAVTLPALTMAGDGSIHLSPSTSAHHQTRNLGAVTGPGMLTVTGNNNNTLVLNAANPGWSGGFVANADDGWRVDASATGCFGTGDVTLNDRASDHRGVTLRINAADVIDDLATLYLNGGKDNRLASKLILNYTPEPEKVAGFMLDGTAMAPGTYDSSSGLTDILGNPLIAGNGSLLVEPPQTGGEVPEPATMALLSLAACGLGGYVRKRRNA